LKQQFDVIVHAQNTTPAQSQISDVSFWGTIYDHRVLLLLLLMGIVVITGGIALVSIKRRKRQLHLQLTIVPSVAADDWNLKRDTP